jgi:hypothetical protein
MFSVKPGQIYVLQLSHGMIKIGRAERAAERIKQHSRSAAAFGVYIEDQWISQDHESTMSTEAELIDRLSGVAVRSQTSNECFYGIEFSEVVKLAESLDYSITQSDVDRYRQLRNSMYYVSRKNSDNRVSLKEAAEAMGYTRQELVSILDRTAYMPSDAEQKISAYLSSLQAA